MKTLITLFLLGIGSLATSADAATTPTLSVDNAMVGPGDTFTFVVTGRPGEIPVLVGSPMTGNWNYPKIGPLDIGQPVVEMILPPIGVSGQIAEVCPISWCTGTGSVYPGYFQVVTFDLSVFGYPATGKSNVVKVTYDPSLIDDCNMNMIADECDISSGFSADINGNGIPDECELDCDNDGKPDGLFPVGGLVWFDVDGDGVMDLDDPGVPNVVVTLFDNSDVVVGGTMTGADGRWKILDVADPQGLRVEFSDYPDFLSPAVAASGTGDVVRYVFGPDCKIDLGLIEPAELCPDGTSAGLATPCYVNGDPLAGGTAGPLAVLVRFPYSSSGLTPNNTYLADGIGMGAVWGLSYSRSTETLYAASFLKRHVGFGPGGIDAIYAVADAKTGANPVTNVSVWLNVNNLPGQNVGSVNRPDLPKDFDQPSFELDAYNKVGKVGLGGMAISDDEKSLYVVNLNSREVLEIDIASKTLVNTYSAITGIQPTNGEARPFAVEYHRGELYVGVVSTGENSGGINDLVMHLRRLDNGVFQDCLTTPLDYPKGQVFVGCSPWLTGWYPWVPFFPSSCGAAGKVGLPLIFPEPMLSDIEFGPDGTVALGLMDRMAHLTGSGNLGLSGPTLYEGISGGDLLKALLENGQCTLELNGSVGGVTTAGANNGEGPGGGEFFFDDRFGVQKPITTYAHWEICLGGVAILPGSDEVVSTVFDPAQPEFAVDAEKEVRTGGVRFFGNTSGDTEDLYKVYNLDQPGAQGKAAGLGDLALLCAPPPIQIGDSVFLDSNTNGIHDASDGVIAGVTVLLYQNSQQVDVAVTNADGEYSFSDLVFCDDTYQVRIDLAQPPLVNLLPAVANFGQSDVADSDGDPTIIPGFVTAPFSTGNAGVNDFSIDFGFRAK